MPPTELKIRPGNQVSIPAEFFLDENPFDPLDPRVTIVGPGGEIVLDGAKPTRISRGVYRFDYEVSADAVPGAWRAIWMANIAGDDVTGTDAFEVLAPQPAESTPDAGRGSRRSRRRIAWVLLAAALGLGTWAAIAGGWWTGPDQQPAAEAPSVQELIEQGVAAQQAGRPDQAHAMYQRVLQIDPGNQVATFNLGALAHNAGDLEEAERLYRLSLDQGPPFQAPMFNLALLKERQGSFEEAAQIYRQSLEQFPDYAPGHLNLGFLLVNHLGQPEQGQESFRRALEVNPALVERIPENLRPEPVPDSPAG